MSSESADKSWLDASESFEARARSLLKEMTDEEKVGQLSYRNPAIPHLGMNPYVWWNEALHGLARSGAATVFPQAIGMAATFNRDRVQKMAQVIAVEGRARHHESLRKEDYGTYKGLTYWSPNINIFRDPRWGRGHETYGEDPFLTATMGVAYVQGLQGDHPKYLKAVATPKHYAVHSGPELTRLSFNSVADERDLRDTYLPAFEACVKAGAQSIMTAYNAYNGEPCSSNTYLVTDILRSDWGFDGAVVTDAGAPEALHSEHKAANNTAEAVAAVLHSGVDVLVGAAEVIADALAHAYQQGLLRDEDVDRAVYNQLLVKFRLGFFDEPEQVPLSDTPFEIIEAPEHLEEARQATQESLVLLRNDGSALPLNKDSLDSIAVIGPNADARDILVGNYFGTPTKQVTVLQGIQNAVPSGCRVWHARGCEHVSRQTEACAELDDRYAEAVSVAERSDVVLLCLGLNPSIEGEAGDAFNAEAGGDKLQIELHDAQETLIEKVAATGTPIVVLMFTGSSIISPAIERLGLPMLHCWYPGAEAGDVIASTLFGEHSPSGRLPVTFYKDTDVLPEFEDYAMDNRTYRYFEGEVAYPFGFGLSYTKFEYSHFRAEREGDRLQFRVFVRNLGEHDADEVVQVYASQKAAFRTPVRSLVAFKRIHSTARGTVEVEMECPVSELALIDPDGRKVAASGRVEFMVGGSQPDARSVELTGCKPLYAQVDL